MHLRQLASMGAAIFLDIPRSFIAIPGRLVIRSGSHLNAIQPFDRNSGDFSMRGPKPGFWRKYEAQQTSLVASCMPRTAVLSGDKPMAIKAPLAVCALPGRLVATPSGWN